MIDNVIVTVSFKDIGFDMELPANAKVSQLKPMISEALAKKGLGASTNIRLICSGGYLHDSDTLFNAGVWDGSIMQVV